MAKARNQATKKQQPKKENAQPKVVEETKPVAEESVNEEVKVNEETKATEETTEQQKVEEPKAEEAKKPASVADTLKSAKTLGEALTALKANSKVKDLVIGIENYIKTIKSNPNPQDYVAANFRLYKLLTTQLDVPNYNLFKTRFDVVLKLFVLGENDVLNPVTVLKYDHFWKYGGKSRAAYGFIITFIDAVKNPKNRRKELQKINLKTFGEYVPGNIVKHIQRYFNV